MKQNGRSMVEMLGVLAIIGVLSIGGIAGYRVAMDTYRANEIMHSVNLHAMETSSYIVSNGALGVDGLYDLGLSAQTETGNDIKTVSNGDWFSVYVTGVSNSVCRRIVNQDWDVEIYVNETLVDTNADLCLGDAIEMEFAFANGLGDLEATDSGWEISPNPMTQSEAEAYCAERGKSLVARNIIAENYAEISTAVKSTETVWTAEHDGWVQLSDGYWTGNAPFDDYYALCQ